MIDVEYELEKIIQWGKVLESPRKLIELCRQVAKERDRAVELCILIASTDRDDAHDWVMKKLDSGEVKQ